MAKNGNRHELFFKNTGGNTVYVIIGAGAAAQDYTYGIPVAPYGSPESTLDFQIQPQPNQNLHTWTSIVSIVTQTGTSTCVYGEQTN